MTRPPCSCSDFTIAVSCCSVTSLELTDRQDWLDGHYWVIDLYHVPLSFCPYCGDPVREVNR